MARHEGDGEAAKPTFGVTLLGHLQRSIEIHCCDPSSRSGQGRVMWYSLPGGGGFQRDGAIPGAGEGWDMAEGWHGLRRDGSWGAGPIFLFLSDDGEEGKGKQNCIWRPCCQLIVSRGNNQVIICIGL